MAPACTDGNTHAWSPARAAIGRAADAAASAAHARRAAPTAVPNARGCLRERGPPRRRRESPVPIVPQGAAHVQACLEGCGSPRPGAQSAPSACTLNDNAPAADRGRRTGAGQVRLPRGRAAPHTATFSTRSALARAPIVSTNCAVQSASADTPRKSAYRSWSRARAVTPAIGGWRRRAHPHAPDCTAQLSAAGGGRGRAWRRKKYVSDRLAPLMRTSSSATSSFECCAAGARGGRSAAGTRRAQAIRSRAGRRQRVLLRERAREVARACTPSTSVHRGGRSAPTAALRSAGAGTCAPRRAAGGTLDAAADLRVRRARRWRGHLKRAQCEAFRVGAAYSCGRRQLGLRVASGAWGARSLCGRPTGRLVEATHEACERRPGWPRAQLRARAARKRLQLVTPPRPSPQGRLPRRASTTSVHCSAGVARSAAASAATSARSRSLQPSRRRQHTVSLGRRAQRRSAP